MNEFEHGQPPLYVSVHIPKTAGTTRREALHSVFGDQFQKADEDRPEFPRVEHPACIHGHDGQNMFCRCDRESPEHQVDHVSQRPAQHRGLPLFPPEENARISELCGPGSENVDRSPRPLLDEAVIRRFRELNAVDYALHRRAVARLEQRKQAYGPSFSEELAHFRERLVPTGARVRRDD